MKKYRLKKDLPTFKAGDEFFIPSSGGLWLIEDYTNDGPISKILAYTQSTLDKFPNILTDWFEEIPEQPETVWDLENGDDFWLVDTSEAEVCMCQWVNVYKPERECGDVFLTREEAEKELARRKAKQILLRDTKGFKPDWKEIWRKDEQVYSVDCSQRYHKLFIQYANDNIYAGIWFKTAEDAEASIKAHEREWKIYLGVEE